MPDKDKAHGVLARDLAKPLLHCDLESEAAGLRKSDPWRRTGRNAKTLVKHDDFRVVLTVMKAGNCLKQHKAAGRISIQTLAGSLRLHLPARTVDLPAACLLALDRAIPHDVEALVESAFLLTIAWPAA